MQQTNDHKSWEILEPEIMELDRYLSSANSPDVEEDLRLCIASGAREMILECKTLGYMTGAGARVLMNAARLMNEAGGRMMVRNLNGQPRDLFAACGLNAFIPSADHIMDVAAEQVA